MPPELAMESKNEINIARYPEHVRTSLSKAIELQQNLYELSSDWNYYKSSEHEYLKKNLRYSLFGTGDIVCEANNTRQSELNPEQEKIIDLIYSRILEASRSRESLYVGTIFNVLCNVANKQEKKYVSPVPVFKVKRCVERDEKPTSEGSNSTTNKKTGTTAVKTGTTAVYSSCVHYVDLEGRIYKNWRDYVTTNTLPKCLMVLPMGGFYQENPSADNTLDKTYVWLEIGPSPLAGQILSYFDTASSVLGLGALGIGVTALAAPALLAAPLLAAGTFCGAISGLYATGRSTHQLVDRRLHQQSISITDRTARSAWFGVAGGLAGGIASGSTFVLNRAARAGMTLGNVSKRAYNAISIGNMVINGSGLGNGIYSIYKNYDEKKEISFLEIGQVVAHVLFFGNAVLNFQTADTIITNTQQQVLQDYEKSLRSNRHRKAFKRIRRNTQASNSDSITADSEIIRGIRLIKNKNDFFAGVVRNRKVFSASDAEVTFKDGYAMINDNVKFDPIELSQQPTEVKINTVSAAKPFNKPAKSNFLQSSKMPESTYSEEISITAENLSKFTGSMITIRKVSDYIGIIIIELKDFDYDSKSNIIQKLAKIALRIVQENRETITRSVVEVIYHLWNFFRPIVVWHLSEMNIDISKIAGSPEVANIAHTVIVTVIDQIFDGVEYVLQEIIGALSQRPDISESNVCSICSGYVLMDS